MALLTTKTKPIVSALVLRQNRVLKRNQAFCPRPGGEIGRRRGFKIPRWKHCAGSSPAPGTIQLFCYPLLRSSLSAIGDSKSPCGRLAAVRQLESGPGYHSAFLLSLLRSTLSAIRDSKSPCGRLPPYGSSSPPRVPFSFLLSPATQNPICDRGIQPP